MVEITSVRSVAKTGGKILVLPTCIEAPVIVPAPASVVIILPPLFEFWIIAPVTASVNPLLTESVMFFDVPKVRLAMVVVAPEFKVG